jgi:hypothetical protein
VAAQRPRTRTLVALALAGLTVAVAACSSSSESSSSLGTDVPLNFSGATSPSKTQGDECTDPTGDLQSDVKGSANLTEPAGVDLVHTEAKVENGNLDVSIQTAGTIESATNPLFIIQQGDTSSVAAMDQSFELRASKDGQAPWALNLITFANNRQRGPQVLNVPITVQGNRLSYSIPLAQLPQIATIVWQFGSSAGVSDDSRIIDECEPFNQSVPTGTTPGSGPSTPSSSPTASIVTGTLGQQTIAPDGSRVTVKQVANPATINRTVLVHPIPQDGLAAIQVSVCAGPDTGVENVADKRFTLQVADGRSFDVWPPDFATQPPFTTGESLRPGECAADGWITYEIPKDAQITQVTYDAGGTGVGPFVVVPAK